MTTDFAEALASLGRGGKLIEEILRQPDAPATRAARLAGVLRSLWPSADLYVCLLRTPAKAETAVLDATGSARPDWVEALRDELGSQLEAVEPGRANFVSLPPRLALPDQQLAAMTVGVGGRGAAILGVAVAAAASESTRELLGMILTSAAEQLGLRLHLEEQQQQLQRLREDLARQMAWANLGVLAAPITHEFNNFLNVILLHMAVLDMVVPAKVRPELAEIRRQGGVMAAIIKQFQRYRRHPLASQLADVNRAVREAVALLPDVQVALRLTADLPLVCCAAADLQRLCTFLLGNASAVLEPGGSITVRTEAAGDKVVLRVEDTGPPIVPEAIPFLFDLNVTVRPGTCALELAACKTLVRRLQGTLNAENRTEGGVAVVLELPAAGTEQRMKDEG